MPRVSKEKNREYQKKWYKENREKQYVRMERREAEIKKKLTEYKSNLKCDCGENHPSCIDFHHIDPKQKEISICKAVTNGWGWERIMKEIEKCKVLCSNCHKKIHWEEMNKSSWGKTNS